MDMNPHLDSEKGNLEDPIWLDCPESGFITELQTQVGVDKINFYNDQFPRCANQVFSILSSDNRTVTNGDPITNGWQYVGVYGAGAAGIMGTSGTSMQFENKLKCHYLLLLSDWKMA